jgi:two-component system cell cycle sensor histidine kinase/response regulator CckA
MNLAEGLPPVRADNMQLEQALLNLCINSRDAMQENGVLTIASRAVSFGRGKMVHPLQTAGSYVVIDVRDTGEGMDQATLARIFEPFFTTKPMDQGTGLGLTMVDMIMKAHNGFVLCESTPGTGTTFTLYFPAETS